MPITAVHGLASRGGLEYTVSRFCGIMFSRFGRVGTEGSIVPLPVRIFLLFGWGMLRHSLCLICCLALLGACTPRKIVVPATPVAPPIVIAPPQTMTEKAAEAWARGDMMESERLYSLALRDPSLPASTRPQAWERLAAAAITNSHTHTGLEVLEAWRTQIPGADNAPGWMHLWERAADQLQPDDVVRRAETLWRDPLRPALVRFGAVRRSLPTGNPALAAVLTGVYSQNDPAGRAGMERELLGALGFLPADALLALVGPAPGPDTQFPWSVFLLETARRTAASLPPGAVDPATGLPVTPVPGADPAASPLTPFLVRLKAVRFADPALLGVLNQAAAGSGQDVPAISMPVPSVQELVAGSLNYAPVCTAMLLPLSGPYAALGASVQAGASTAQQQMQRAGVSIDLRLIDTESPNWLNELTQLPAECVTVGGPLQPDAYAEVKARNVPGGRAVFAFLSKLGEGDEGYAAWRFFPGREDQILAMLRFARQLGVFRFGIFHPEDDYGNAMANEFTSLATRDGGSVTGSMAYPPDAPEQWTQLAGRFVGVRVVNKVPIPSGLFRGIFLPDSWRNMDMVISSLFYQGEDSCLLMGTSLWEQVLLETPQQVLTNVHLGFVVFPGMWNPRSLEVPARLLQAGLSGRRVDTWAALGYDFVRFASALNLRPGWKAQDVNMRLSQIRGMTWSMAPLRWQGGRVSQDMFVLAPAKDAPALIDAGAFKRRFDEARVRSDRRATRAAGRI